MVRLVLRSGAKRLDTIFRPLYRKGPAPSDPDSRSFFFRVCCAKEGDMDMLTRLSHFFADDRLLTNLIAVHVGLGAILVVSFIVRKLLLHGGNSLVRWTGLHWLDHVGKEANRRIRTLMFWTTLLALTATAAAGVVYHVAGRDARTDLAE